MAGKVARSLGRVALLLILVGLMVVSLCRKRRGLRPQGRPSPPQRPSTAVEGLAHPPPASPMTEPRFIFDYSAYETSPGQFQLWIDRIFAGLGQPLVVTAGALGSVVFLVGLFASLAIGFHEQYLQTFPVYLGAFGIAWVCGALHVGSLSIHKFYAELRPCFLVSDEEYRGKIDLWFRRMVDKRGNLLSSLTLAALACGVAYLAFLRRDTWVALFGSQPPILFPTSWYELDHLPVRVGIVMWYGSCIALALGTSM